MNKRIRFAVSSLIIVAASNVSAGVITQDGVVFTSTYTGNVLTLQIDAAGRTGGWASASAINALSIKTIGTFSGVTMSAPGSAWSLSSSELNAGGCSAVKGKSGTSAMTRLCYTGTGIALADNMRFTFTFAGAPDLSAPHLKVRFVDAQGRKTGSLLSLDFPVQLASAPVGNQGGSAGSTGSGSSTGSGGSTGSTSTNDATAPTGNTSTTVPADAVASTGSTGSASGQAGVIGTPTGGAALPPELIPSPPSLPLPGTEQSLPSQELIIVIGAPGDKEGDASEVPEPQSLAILGLGLATMGMARRRKSRAAR